MTDIAIAQRTTTPTIELQPQSPESTSENRLKAAVEHARRLTQMHGCQNVDVAIAWETVEELRTVESRQPTYPSEPTYSCQAAFDHYCAETPHALECRTYDC